MFRDVLIGLDHSPAAAQALAQAIALADRHGGRLTILTAIPPVQGWPAGPVESLTAARQLAVELEQHAVALQQRAVELVPRCLPVTTVLRHERPCAALLSRIEEGHHDLLVLGDDGTRRLRLRRSLTERLERRAAIPVLVVGADGTTALHTPAGDVGRRRPRADGPRPVIAENGNAG
ncbi:MAG TPA: universal stress protein [Baekduia sp.]|nr:universal stress protein [Baekduia sp.]